MADIRKLSSGKRGSIFLKVNTIDARKAVFQRVEVITTHYFNGRLMTTENNLSRDFLLTSLKNSSWNTEEFQLEFLTMNTHQKPFIIEKLQD